MQYKKRNDEKKELPQASRSQIYIYKVYGLFEALFPFSCGYTQKILAIPKIVYNLI